MPTIGNIVVFEVEKMNYSDLTDEELESLSRECFLKKEALVKEYRETHGIFRGVISTPEIDALRQKRNDLTREYLKRHARKK